MGFSWYEEFKIQNRTKIRQTQPSNGIYKNIDRFNCSYITNNITIDTKMKDITYKLQISVNGRQEFTISTVDYDLLYQEIRR